VIGMACVYLGLLPPSGAKDRSFHELDILFAKQVTVRNFKTTNVDAFDEHEAN
jgi:hypothetical protein